MKQRSEVSADEPMHTSSIYSQGNASMKIVESVPTNESEDSGSNICFDKVKAGVDRSLQ